MKPIILLLAAALLVLACTINTDEPQAQADQMQLAAYYPGVATYTPDKIVGAEVELDTPYVPKQAAPVQYANYANYAGNYASGQYQYNSRNNCYGEGGFYNGGPIMYGWNGNGFPIMRAGLRVGARVASFPFRVIGRLFGRC